MKKFILGLTFIGVLVGSYFLVASFDECESCDKEDQKGEKFITYKDIDEFELKKVLDDRDIFLIDVRVPETSHIPGTDETIDFQKIKDAEDRLPTDKDAEIIVYCQSGRRSEIASQALVEMGYANVSNLEGGIVSWVEAGYSLVD